MSNHIGVVGMGNVGAALLMQLPAVGNSNTVTLASRDVGHAKAVLLDVASAYPQAASNYKAVSQLKGNFDIIVVTAGAMPHGDMSIDDLLKTNLNIVIESLKAATFTHLVVIGTPIDRLTEALHQHMDFTDKSIIGFGGQLDVARAQYALLQHQLPADEVYVIGEHGPRAIPVYAGEDQYETIQSDTTSVLKRISEFGKPRNMATGVQLARLVAALTGDEQTLCVSVPHNEYDDLSLTWPYAISTNGVGERTNLLLETTAHASLTQLIETRKTERKATA